MIKKMSVLLTLSLSIMLSLSSSAFAFDDLQGHPAESKIESLFKNGIVSGIDELHFDPMGTLTYAQGVQLIVKGLKLNLDNLKFIKQPLASDYYTNLPDRTWFSDSFVIAYYNGLDIPKDVDPSRTMTKQVFYNLLYQALGKKADFTPIQTLLLTKIMSLDKNNALHPRSALTRSEASEIIYNTIEFLQHYESGISLSGSS
ncbi:hypothetical protein [Paenibacillus sp. KN14-4R]|uniref:hypothetical protein n=1 Tax=Paenibacillus sp. KN14-4R TaxID=3445773 RepID=UPI003FA0B10F